MVMQIKKIERPNPQNREERRWYLAKAPGKSVGLDEIARSIEKRSTLSRADVMAVLYALVEVIPEHLINGDSVRLGALGSFRASLSSQPAATEASLNASMVKGVKVSFQAGTEVKQAMAGARFQIV